MLDTLAAQFLAYGEEVTGSELMVRARCSGLFHTGVTLGRFLSRQFPSSLRIKNEYALCLHNTGDIEGSYDILQELLSLRGLSHDEAFHIFFNQHFCIDHVEKRYASYDKNKVREICDRVQIASPFPLVTFSVTSCKRLDLFTQTINSFIACCTDWRMIDRWICVDDNSSSEDRIAMQKMYPFFEFHMKSFEEKGHPQSMNIIREMVKTPYLFHIEDDWSFFSQKSYISDCLDVLSHDESVMQCLVNKNYAEVEKDVCILGGDPKTSTGGVRYFVHVNANTEEEKIAFVEKYGSGLSQYYWPHYSFRPSLINTRVLRELGPYNETISHFEMEYAYRYVQKGWKSAFLEGIYCIHIGRLTSERHDATKSNAYVLNNESQLAGKEQAIAKDSQNALRLETFVVNLDRRTDRWNAIESTLNGLHTLECIRYPAVDGSTLVPNVQLQQIFDGNDYNMRRGMVGCALSHIQLYIDLLHSDASTYCILEDDITFVPEFDAKLAHVYDQVKDFEWDMLYLGHHLAKDWIADESYDRGTMPRIEKWNRTMSLNRSLGGTGGYLISKSGAKKLLAFINKTGMTNGIDTVQQKAGNDINIFYSIPHLIYSDCYRGDNRGVDTDIQFNYDSLSIRIEERIDLELAFYDQTPALLLDVVSAKLSAEDKDLCNVCYYCSADILEVCALKSASIHPCYTLDDQAIFFVPGGHPERYFERLNKGLNGDFNIKDAIMHIRW
jgi:GR25 family glycosyltransferase involved in LPS biosynthesis/GT2 family glycosyltransferase